MTVITHMDWFWIGSDIFMLSCYTSNVSDNVFYIPEDGYVVG